MSRTTRELIMSKKKTKIGDGKDRISDLPDAILVYILSFLPTKDAVATSVLQSSWKTRWASVPILNFDDENLLVSHKKQYWVPDSLMNFVDRVLLVQNLSSLSKFRLHCVGDIDLHRVNGWITTVVKRQVQEIDIGIHSKNRLYLPQSLCSSQTLVYLRLGYRLNITIPATVSFPSLKSLEISFLHPNNNLMKKLFCSCPVLENLIIEALLGHKKMVLHIVTPTLKTLRISLSAHNVKYYDYSVVIDTPSLENLSISDELLVCYSGKNLSSLVTARIYLGQSCIKDENRNHANRIYNILQGLSNVKSLRLSSQIWEVLNFADHYNFKMFFNLTRLEVYICICYGWTQLLSLLKSMPNLETLKLHSDSPPSKYKFNRGGYSESEEEEEDDYKDGDEDESTVVASQEVPSCLLSHLKEIKLVNFKGHKMEMILLKYFLKNAEVLQKVMIGSCYRMPETEKGKFWQELSSFPKGSKTCHVEFLHGYVEF